MWSRRISFWNFRLPSWVPQLSLGGRRRYSGFHIPFENFLSLVHGSIFKFNVLRVRNTLLLGSAPTCHSNIILRSAPLRLQVFVHLLLVENHILVPKDLAVLGIPKPIAVLISAISNEDAPPRLWVQLAPVTYLNMDIRNITKCTQVIQVYLFDGPCLLESHSSEALRILCWSETLPCWLHLERTA